MAGCFAFLFIPAGVWIAAYGLWCVWKSIRSRTWAEVPGRIVNSTIQQELDSDRFPSYRFRVSYTYSVGGRELVGTRAQFGDSMSVNLAVPAEKLLQKYPVGSSVRVRYSPDHPEQSTLESAIGAPAILSLVIGILLIAFGVAFALLS